MVHISHPTGSSRDTALLPLESMTAANISPAHHDADFIEDANGDGVYDETMKENIQVCVIYCSMLVHTLHPAAGLNSNVYIFAIN